MQKQIRNLLLPVFAMALCAAIALTIIFAYFGFDQGALKVDLFTTFVDGYKTIGIGFLVAVLGVIIPQLLPEEKYRFERLRDSREAYSRAQTGITYLPHRMADLQYMDAVKLLQSTHESLHLAQTYEELAQHLAPYDKPEKWGPSKYRTLMAIKEVMQGHAQAWDSLSREDRLSQLQAAIEQTKKER